MPAEGGEILVAAYLYGGQGTMNVPSWSPDGSQVAFVSYSAWNRRTLQVPQTFRRNPEEVKTALLTVFGPEQLAALKDVDLTNLPPGSKTVTEMISEDREDRF